MWQESSPEASSQVTARLWIPQHESRGLRNTAMLLHFYLTTMALVLTSSLSRQGVFLSLKPVIKNVMMIITIANSIIRKNRREVKFCTANLVIIYLMHLRSPLSGNWPHMYVTNRIFRSQMLIDVMFVQILDPQIIKTKWRFAASLNIPGKPKLKPYTGTTVYSINREGLIYQHKEEWDISALDAFVSILFPSFGAQPAPPVSNPIDIWWSQVLGLRC